ncbi:MAG: sodium:solute symporter, partial [bacterium]
MIFAGDLKWFVLLGYGIFLWWLSPWSEDSDMFYQGKSQQGDPVSFWLLTGSVFISWIFAKSITNAANLAASYGLTGGLAYSAWYLSIPVAGVVIYFIRDQYDVESLAEFLTTKYGEIAALTFMIAIFIRLFNEIWSNTIVVGTYFGSKGTLTYYMACGAFVLITLLYSLRGGLRSSVLTDSIQVLLMVFFLSLVLGYILPGRSGELVTAGELTMAGGLDLLL